MTERFKRMLQCIETAFNTRQDPHQIQVNTSQRKTLEDLHPNCLSSIEDDDGPWIWALMFPTRIELADAFIQGKINENQLLCNAPVSSLQSLYLCSVTALPEIRNQGKSYALCLKSAKALCADFNICELLVWPHSVAGLMLAQKLQNSLQLPLRIKDINKF